MSDEDIPARLWVRVHRARLNEAIEPFTEAEIEWARTVVLQMADEDDTRKVMES